MMQQIRVFLNRPTYRLRGIVLVGIAINILWFTSTMPKNALYLAFMAGTVGCICLAIAEIFRLVEPHRVVLRGIGYLMMFIQLTITILWKVFA